MYLCLLNFNWFNCFNGNDFSWFIDAITWKNVYVLYIFVRKIFKLKSATLYMYYFITRCAKKTPHHYKHRNITFTNKVLKSRFQSVFGQPVQPLNHFKNEVWEMNRPFLIWEVWWAFLTMPIYTIQKSENSVFKKIPDSYSSFFF